MQPIETPRGREPAPHGRAQRGRGCKCNSDVAHNVSVKSPSRKGAVIAPIKKTRRHGCYYTSAVWSNSFAAWTNPSVVRQLWRVRWWSRGLVIWGRTAFCPDCRASSSSRLLARAPTISLEKGQTLFEIGAIGDGCYWLEEGVLKVTSRRLRAQSGSSLFSDRERSSANSQCLTGCRGPLRFKRSDSKLRFVARSIFLECLADYQDLQSPRQHSRRADAPSR